MVYGNDNAHELWACLVGARIAGLETCTRLKVVGGSAVHRQCEYHCILRCNTSNKVTSSNKGKRMLVCGIAERQKLHARVPVVRNAEQLQITSQ